MHDGHCRVRRALCGTLDDRVRCVIKDMVGHVEGDTAALEKKDNGRQTRRKKK
jgi:hypothetical protein